MESTKKYVRKAQKKSTLGVRPSARKERYPLTSSVRRGERVILEDGTSVSLSGGDNVDGEKERENVIEHEGPTIDFSEGGGNEDVEGEKERENDEGEDIDDEREQEQEVDHDETPAQHRVVAPTSRDPEIAAPTSHDPQILQGKSIFP